MLAPIPIKQTNTGIKALQIPIANEKKSVEKNVVSDSHIKTKLIFRRQNTNNIPSCNITSYQQEYQYQTYFIHSFLFNIFTYTKTHFYSLFNNEFKLMRLSSTT